MAQHGHVESASYHFIKMTPDAFFSATTERVLRLAELGFGREVHLSDVF